METLINYDKYQYCYRGNALISSELKMVDRYTTPNFHELKASGAYLHPLPYEAIHVIVNDPVRTCTSGYRNYGEFTEWSFTSNDERSPVGPWVDHPPIEFMSGDLGSKIVGKLNDIELNLAMAWWDRKDTFRMISKTCLQLYRAARFTRKGKFSRAAKTLGVKLSQRQSKRMKRRDRIDQFSDNWLELRYGWLPTLYDIYAAAGLITQGITAGGEKFVKLHTSEKEEIVGQPQYSGSLDLRYGGSTVFRRRHGAGIDFVIVDEEMRFEDALGLSNPGLFIWETIPGSFLLDWILPIGDSLRAMTAYKGLRFVSGYEYWKEEYFCTVGPWAWYDYIQGLSGRYPVYRDPNGGYSYIRQHFKRTVIEQFKDLHNNPWETANGMNAVRALDAVALLQGILRPQTKFGDFSHA